MSGRADEDIRNSVLRWRRLADADSVNIVCTMRVAMTWASPCGAGSQQPDHVEAFIPPMTEEHDGDRQHVPDERDVMFQNCRTCCAVDRCGFIVASSTPSMAAR